MYLLDTNVLSEARRGRVEARAWLSAVDSEQLFLSTITLGEINKGANLKSRTDPVAGLALIQWLARVRLEHGNRILSVDDDVALEWGRIASLGPRNMADGLIAATAKVHRKILVTRNVADFQDLDLLIVNPWNPA